MENLTAFQVYEETVRPMTVATLSVSLKKAKKKSTEDYIGELFLTHQEGVPECRIDTVILLTI